MPISSVVSFFDLSTKNYLRLPENVKDKQACVKKWYLDHVFGTPGQGQGQGQGHEQKKVV